MSPKGNHHDVAFGSALNDIPTLDDVRLDGGFFAGVDRGEWIRNLEHHFRYGEELLMLWSEPGVGKSALLTQLASRLDPAVYSVVTMDARRGGSAEHLWGALDRRLSLPHGAEGWEALKGTAKKLASSGHSLAIIIDHADKLNKEAIQLLRAMLDVRLPECRFVLAMDGAGVSTQGQWPHIEAMLFERGQLARLWPFGQEDALAYLDFRIQHAKLGDVVLTEKQQQLIFERSEGNAGLIKAELQRMLTAGELLGRPATKGRKPAATPKKSHKPAASTPGNPATSTTKPKRTAVLPKAHTVAVSMLAIALLGFYLVWEQPIPESVILTPSPTAQNLPPVIKTLEETGLPVTQQIESEPPASGGLANPVKFKEGGDEIADNTVPSPAFASQSNMEPPAGFSPSNVPLMATQGTQKRSSGTPGETSRSLPETAAPNSAAPLLAKEPVRAKEPVHTQEPIKISAIKATAPKTIDSKPIALQSVEKNELDAKSSTADKALGVTDKQKTPPKNAPKASSPVTAKSALPIKPTVKSAAKPIALAKAAPIPKKAGYTLQIMGLRDERSVQAFMQRNAGVKGLRYHTTRLNGQPWYVIVQGEYASRQAAQAAVKSLPAPLQASNPFPKSLSALQ